MSLENLKFTSEELEGNDIASLPDRPGDIGMTAAQLKARFDLIGKTFLALGRFNDLIEILLSNGAENIGVATIGDLAADNVQAALAELYGLLSEGEFVKASQVLTRNNESEYSPIGEYNPATKKYVDSIAIESGAVTSVFGRAGEVIAKDGDYNYKQVGAAKNPTEITATLLADNWQGDSAPFKYSLAVAEVTALSKHDLIPAIVTDQEKQAYFEALQGANIQDDGQSAGVINLVAMGEKPVIDLPIRILLGGDVDA